MKTKYIPLLFLICFTASGHSSKQLKLDEAKRSIETKYLQEQIQLSKAAVNILEEEQNIMRNEINVLREQLSDANKKIENIQISSEKINNSLNNIEGFLDKENSSTLDNSISGREHIVEAGHTLSAIAIVYGASVKEIKKVNNLSSDNIYVGQKLFIPE